MVKVKNIGGHNMLRVQRGFECPICGKPDWCLVSEDQTWCVCERIPNAENPSWGTGTVYYLTESQKRSVELEEMNSEKLANVNILHKVFSLVISVLGITDEHVTHLMSSERGLTREQIALRGYASATEETLNKQVTAYRSNVEGSLRTIWEDLFVKNGLSKDAWIGIPGFYIPQGHQVPIFSPMHGLLIPCRNEFGQIIGMQVRVDADKINVWGKIDDVAYRVRVEKADGYYHYTVRDARDFEIVEEGQTQSKTVSLKNGKTLKIKESAKYVWVSSAGKTKGTAQTSFTHFAFSDEVLKMALFDSNGFGKRNLFKLVDHVIVTEGLLKGDIVASIAPKTRISKLGKVAVVSMAGVSSWGRVTRHISKYKVPSVFLAFDQDFEDNDSVFERMSDTINELVNNLNVIVKVMVWSTYKGLDDYLLKASINESITIKVFQKTIKKN